jgi:hypothetical protein
MHFPVFLLVLLFAINIIDINAAELLRRPRREYKARPDFNRNSSDDVSDSSEGSLVDRQQSKSTSDDGYAIIPVPSCKFTKQLVLFAAFELAHRYNIVFLCIL